MTGECAAVIEHAHAHMFFWTVDMGQRTWDRGHYTHTIYIHTYIHTYVHTYIHTHIHTYIRAWLDVGQWTWDRGHPQGSLPTSHATRFAVSWLMVESIVRIAVYFLAIIEDVKRSKAQELAAAACS